VNDAARVDRDQLASEVAHWVAACDALRDLDVVAAPAAWSGLERYVDAGVRSRLRETIDTLTDDARRLAAALTAAATPDDLAWTRERLLALRQRYLRAETVLDFFGDAINSRTNPRLAALLRGLDALAVESMAVALRPLGVEVPPVLTYVDKGMGASIVRAGVRLWDAGSPSPVAAIKITRHNVLKTALVHETGHQVAHLSRWTGELAELLRDELGPAPSELADAFSGWAGEIGADVYAFAVLGSAPVFALANVVDGTTRQVYAMPPFDPHPFAYLRVLLNVALVRTWFGPGPWDGLEAAWLRRHPVDAAPPHVAALTRASIPLLGRLATAMTQARMRAFGGRSLAELVDPRRVAPAALAALARRAGASLLTSTYLQRQETMRIFAWLTYQAANPAATVEARRQLEDWIIALGSEPLARSA